MCKPTISVIDKNITFSWNCLDDKLIKITFLLNLERDRTTPSVITRIDFVARAFRFPGNL